MSKKTYYSTPYSTYMCLKPKIFSNLRESTTLQLLIENLFRRSLNIIIELTSLQLYLELSMQDSSKRLIWFRNKFEYKTFRKQVVGCIHLRTKIQLQRNTAKPKGYPFWLFALLLIKWRNFSVEQCIKRVYGTMYDKAGHMISSNKWCNLNYSEEQCIERAYGIIYAKKRSCDFIK